MSITWPVIVRSLPGAAILPACAARGSAKSASTAVAAKIRFSIGGSPHQGGTGRKRRAVVLVLRTSTAGLSELGVLWAMTEVELRLVDALVRGWGRGAPEGLLSAY